MNSSDCLTIINQLDQGPEPADMFERVEVMASNREKWKGIDQWAMVRGKQSVAKYGKEPNEQFALYGAGPEILGHWPTYQEAMAEADRVRK